MRVRLITALLVLLVIGGTAHAQTSATDDWTFMHYFFLDNDLEPQIFGDTAEIMAAGSTDAVNFVAQIDRTAGYEGRFGDWTDTRRFNLTRVDRPVLTLADKQILVSAYIATPSWDEWNTVLQQVIDSYTADAAVVEEFLSSQGLDPSDEARLDQLVNIWGLANQFDIEPLEVLGEVDMGTSEALADFIIWSVQNYPAQKYALIISSHGGGWTGNGPDYDSDKSQLSIPEIVEALEIVGFDACLMGQIEVYSALAPYTRYVLAAEEVIPGQGWEYTAPLTALIENPSMDAAEIGQRIIDGYMDYYAGRGARTQVDLHLVDPSGAATVISAINDFVSAAEPTMAEEMSAIGISRTNAQEFNTEVTDVLTSVSGRNAMSSVDLIDLMTLISVQTDLSDEMVSAAQAVIDAARAMVVYSKADAELPGANGVAIYFPINAYDASLLAPTEEQYPPYSQSAPLLGVWTGFLLSWYETIETQLGDDNLSIQMTDVLPNDGTASIYDPPVVLFDTNGQGISDITFTAILKRDDGTQIMLDYSPLTFQTLLLDGTLVQSYPNGLTEGNQFSWNVEMPVISDGVAQIPALVQTTSGQAASRGYVAGVVTPQNGGDPVPVSVIFDLETKTAIKTYATSENGAPYELSTAPGDTFTPYWATYDAEGNFAYTPADGSLKYGAVPFTFAYAPAESGTYSLGISLSDYAGNNQLSTIDVTVNNADLDTNWRGFKQIDWGVNFLFPWGWLDPTVIEGETEDDQLIAVSDPDGNFIIYVGVSADDFETTVANSVEFINSLDDGATNEPESFDELGYHTMFIDYVYSLDGEPRTGAYYVIEIPENEAVYTIDFDASEAHVEEALPVLIKMLESLTFFTPVDTGA